MDIRPVAAGLFYADRQTDEHDKAKQSLFTTLRKRLKITDKKLRPGSLMWKWYSAIHNDRLGETTRNVSTANPPPVDIRTWYIWNAHLRKQRCANSLCPSVARYQSMEKALLYMNLIMQWWASGQVCDTQLVWHPCSKNKCGDIKCAG